MYTIISPPILDVALQINHSTINIYNQRFQIAYKLYRGFLQSRKADVSKGDDYMSSKVAG